MRSRIYYILIPMLALVTLIGVAIGIRNMNKRDANVTDTTIMVDGEELTTSEVSLSGMAPGETKAYTMSLTADKQGTYEVTLDFQGEGDNSLGAYVMVCITIGDSVIDEALLSEYLDGRAVNFRCDLTPETERLLKVTYAMDVDIGNEAQGATADFVIVLSATAE